MSERDSDPLLSPKEIEGEVESSLRPRTLREYIGQEKIKEKLGLFVEAAKQRDEPLDHVLLAGPPGLGKTTLSQIIARELGSEIHFVTGPNVDKKGDLAAILTNLNENDVLFIDEIHRLHRAIEEVLYGAMEDFQLDLIIGQGPAAKTLKIDLPPFTLIGATTRTGLLSGPLRDRFGVQLRLDYYPAKDIQTIVERSAKVLGVSIATDASHEIARRSRGTPRIANRLLKRVRDFAQVRGDGGGSIRLSDSKGALELFEVDSRGLDALDRKYLLTIIDKFEGGPVGVENLASALGEERDTLEEIVEPYLIQEGFLQRTPRGRVAAKVSFDHLGREFVDRSAQRTLFQESV